VRIKFLYSLGLELLFKNKSILVTFNTRGFLSRTVESKVFLPKPIPPYYKMWSKVSLGLKLNPAPYNKTSSIISLGLKLMLSLLYAMRVTVIASVFNQD
jgi:hypothetical protein